jgi:hypothetical protein
MENNKYYVPEIEEFHVGFECELHMSISTNFCRSNKETWNKMIMHETDILYNIKNYTDKDKIRVKFLDREDIESEGWELYSKGNINFFTFRKPTNDFIQIHVKFGEVSKISFSTRDGLESMDFIIKNKSELRKLMKQLNIE